MVSGYLESPRCQTNKKVPGMAGIIVNVIMWTISTIIFLLNPVEKSGQIYFVSEQQFVRKLTGQKIRVVFFSQKIINIKQTEKEKSLCSQLIHTFNLQQPEGKHHFLFNV